MLATDGEMSYVVFLYLDKGIQWSTGDASGGSDGLGAITAQAGFDNGDGVNSLQLPGAMTADILDIENSTNVGDPGYFIFAVHVKPQADVKKGYSISGLLDLYNSL